MRVREKRQGRCPTGKRDGPGEQEIARANIGAEGEEVRARA